MKKLRIYLDTSVFGGAFDVEFADESQRLFADIRLEKVIPLISETLTSEVAAAPLQVQELLQEISGLNVELLYFSEEAIELQKEYLKAGVVTSKYADDALHVASATIARADVIVSWNYRHLVNPVRIRAFNGVNLTHGYGTVIILTPTDIVNAMEIENE